MKRIPLSRVLPANTPDSNNIILSKTSKMYNHGDKGGKTHSANMVSDRVAMQMSALEQRGDKLEENQ